MNAIHRLSKRKRTDSSSDDEPEICQPQFESRKNPIASRSAANSSVRQQSNSSMPQSEVDCVLRRISMEVQRLNAELIRKEVYSPEIQRLNEKLGEKDASLVEIQLKLTQSESDKSKYAELFKEEVIKLKLFQHERDREKHVTLAKHQDELSKKSLEIVKLRENSNSLEAQLQHKQKVIEQLKEVFKEDLINARRLKSQYFQLYNDETVKLKSVQLQFESEKEKNRQLDQQLLEQQKELTDKSVEIHSKSGEIVKLRQTAQSLRGQLELKSNENLSIKSQVKTALEAELNCPICSQPITQAVVTVECGHLFCQNCLDQWINEGHQTCPFCRSECHRSAPVVAIQQLQAKLLSCVNGELPILSRSE